MNAELTRCNLGLVAPRCQSVQCGREGTGCSDAALCQLGMACIDPVSFGLPETATHGQCTSLEHARAICVDNCVITAPLSETPCSPTQRERACSTACEQYPDGWKPQCVPSSFVWYGLDCSVTSCRLGMSCYGAPESNRLWDMVFELEECT